MTQRADLFHEVVCPTLPAREASELDSSDAGPISGITKAVAIAPQRRLNVGGMGTCLFIVVDGVLFAGLFGIYATVHAAHPEIFAHGRYFLNPITGAAASSALLLSCLTAAFAVEFARRGSAARLGGALGATIVLAGFFLGIQGAEYSDKFERRLLPGRYFLATEPVWKTDTFRREHPRAAEYADRFRLGDPTREDERGASRAALKPLISAGALGKHAVFPNVPSEPHNAHAFFGVYFLFSGLHAVHVLGGAALWAWLLSRARRGVDERRYLASVDYAALYWSFITIVRVLIFPLFYLVR
jgi:cytochrome c oxidase subunit III